MSSISDFSPEINFIDLLFKIIRFAVKDEYLSIKDFVYVEKSRWYKIFDIYYAYDKSYYIESLITSLGSVPLDNKTNLDYNITTINNLIDITKYDIRYPIKETIINNNILKFDSIDEKWLLDYLKKEGSFMSSYNDNIFYIDLSFYDKYQVREGYIKYGASITYTNDEITYVTVLENKVGRNHSCFNKYLKIFVCTMTMHIILILHATFCHLNMAQSFLHKYNDMYNGFTLHEKKLFSIFIHRVNDINKVIPVLAGSKGSLFHRAFSFTESSIIDVIKDRYNYYAEMSGNQVKDFMLGNIGTLWHNKSKLIYDECYKLIKEYVRDDYVTCFTNILFCSTFLHECVGDRQLDNILTYRMYPLLNNNYNLLPTYESVLCVITATIGVSTRIPKISSREVNNFINDNEMKKSWSNFVDNLKLILNDKSMLCDVDNMEISVGY